MDGVLPMALSLNEGSARSIGAYVTAGLVAVVRPPLNRIETALNRLHDDLRMLGVDVVDVFSGITDRRLKVQVMNEELLDHIEATRWAVAYFSYNKFLELLDHIAYMRWLDGRSHLHLHDIRDGLTTIQTLLAIFATEVGGMGSQIIGLLQQILDRLDMGIPVSGTIQIIVTGADPLANLDLLKLLGLLGLLALGLAIIVAFLFGVGAALATFTLKALPAAGAVAILIAALIPLIKELVKLEGWDFLKIAGGFLLIAGFVYLLGKAFQQFTTDLDKVVPQLKTFFESIANLMKELVKFQGWDFAKIAGGFLLIAGFVYLLGIAFKQFGDNLDKIIPQLNTFFTSITDLMKALAKFSPGEMVTIAVGFLLIAGFVYVLGLALNTLTENAIKAIDPLAGFFTAIKDLMTALARFSPGEMFQIAIGFVIMAGFVWLLSMAINTLTAQAVTALPGLTGLLGALTTLAQTLAAMTAGEMFTMAIGLILIAAFVWAIAAALVYAAGPLATLATLFESLGSVLSTVGDIASGVWGVLSDIGGFIGDIGGGIGDFFGGIGDSLFGSIDVNAMMGQTALAAAAPPPPPPAPVAAGGGAAAGLGALAPGGALAAAPVGGATTVDQTVNAGGITVSIAAERLEANSADLLTDDIVAQLQARLGTLRSTQDFQAGARPATA